MGKKELFLALGLKEFDLSPAESRLCPVGRDAFSLEVSIPGGVVMEILHSSSWTTVVFLTCVWYGTGRKGPSCPLSLPSTRDLNAH